jgi:hypothetical protein
MLTKKAKTQNQSAALTYLPSVSRSKIVAANQICIAMNAAKNANPAMMKPNRDSKRSIAPSLALSSVALHTPASTSAQRFLVRKLAAVEDSCTMARDDEIVAPEQLLAARHLVGSKECQIRTEIVACTHLGLFLGASTLLHTWSKIGRWLAAC